jgi:hypothetical protein
MIIVFNMHAAIRDIINLVKTIEFIAEISSYLYFIGTFIIISKRRIVGVAAFVHVSLIDQTRGVKMRIIGMSQ